MSNTEMDTTACDREPIHLLGEIQPFGLLLAVTNDWRISHASTNLSDFLEVPADAALGQPLDALLLPEAMHSIRGAVQAMASVTVAERLFNLSLQKGRKFDLALHRSDRWIVLEAEPCAEEDKFDAVSSTRTMIGRLQGPSTVLQLCQEAARQVRALTGFDRVMVYRFDEDGSGEVVAERAQSMLQPYLGLHYPASDIPRQARELYLRNTFRLIADVAATPVAILTRAPGDSPPLDLTLSGLRSVSPTHLHYLRNMGVACSMSLSVLQEGKLWGLIVCHHGQPRPLSLSLRTTADLFGQMFSFMLESRQRDLERVQQHFYRGQLDRVMASLGNGGSVFDMLESAADHLRATIGCDGLVVSIDGRLGMHGATPDQHAMTRLDQFVGRTSPHAIFSANNLAEIYPPAVAFADVAAGVLVIPVRSMEKSYLHFFRGPRDHTRIWAGEPGKVVANEGAGDLLRPRASFAAWTEQVRGRCVPWSQHDLRTADHLQGSLREVVFKTLDGADRAYAAESSKKEVLIAELNHRMRNILGLVRGLVSQSHDGAVDVDDFVETISGRIQALARAHDQITAVQWADTPLLALVQAEAMAYLIPGLERLIACGPGVLLDPHSFPTVALVIHELMTNSAKYGALSTTTGRVSVTWAVDDAGQLALRWEEKNGPLVREPNRRGFGTTLISRSIPFDLKGTASIDYAPAGLIAHFTIPAAFFCLSAVSQGPAAPQHAAAMHKLDGDVLVVEDNLIIALNAEDILLRLGAKRVHTGSNEREALHVIAHYPITFALLDFSLGKETSTSVALELLERGIPFVFGTGYGRALQLPPRLSHVRVISKPYTVESFREAGE